MKSSIAFVGLLPVLLVALCQACLAQQENQSSFHFDIPARPLGQALADYAATTRHPTLYRSEIIAQRLSAPLRGFYSAQQALEKMLTGTGLQIEPYQVDGTHGFILKLAPQVPATERPGDYAVWLQQRLWRSLCGNRAALSGAYRVLLRIRIDGTGRLPQPQLLTSSGDARRDRAILAALQATQLNILPPATMPQPLTILLIPEQASASDDCARWTEEGA